MEPQEALQLLRQRLGEAIGDPAEFRDEWSVVVARDHIVAACQLLKEECGFAMLTDLSGVDNLGDEFRFEVDYLLCSLTHRCHVRLKVHLPEDDPVVDSVAAVWRTADWHEREAYDMYGIGFRGHPDLKRILMWEGYPYHPLRKDFPLAGLPAGLPATAEGSGQAETAPMLGGPFVPGRGQNSTVHREPRQYDTAAEQGEKAAQPNRQEPV